MTASLLTSQLSLTYLTCTIAYSRAKSSTVQSLFYNAPLNISYNVLNTVLKVKNLIIIQLLKVQFLLKAYHFHTIVKTNYH